MADIIKRAARFTRSREWVAFVGVVGFVLATGVPVVMEEADKAFTENETGAWYTILLAAGIGIARSGVFSRHSWDQVNQTVHAKTEELYKRDDSIVELRVKLDDAVAELAKQAREHRADRDFGDVVTLIAQEATPPEQSTPVPGVDFPKAIE